MKTVGIIAEFNPLHNGHVYLIEKAKEAGGTLIVAMSGNFTQRGEPACLDKYERAEYAVKAGADIVMEIPVQFAAAPADKFAKGAVQTLCTFKGFDTLVFGSESGDINRLDEVRRAVSDAESNPLFKEKLTALMKTGMSFVKARAEILGFAEITRPNDILGIEYLNAIADKGIKPVAVKRLGAGYSEKTLDKQFASASGIRQSYKDGADFSAFVPEYINKSLIDCKKELYTLAKYVIGGGADLSCVFDMGEGLDNRFAKLIAGCPDYGTFINEATSKRYTSARISRLLLYTLLGFDKKTADKLHSTPYSYVNILACKKSALGKLGDFAVPAVTKPSDFKRFSAEDRLFDKAASLWYALTGIAQRPMSIAY